eukprot:106108-Prorocentrum_minimum.AAC.2
MDLVYDLEGSGTDPQQRLPIGGNEPVESILWVAGTHLGTHFSYISPYPSCQGSVSTGYFSEDAQGPQHRLQTANQGVQGAGLIASGLPRAQDVFSTWPWQGRQSVVSNCLLCQGHVKNQSRARGKPLAMLIEFPNSVATRIPAPCTPCVKGVHGLPRCIG